MDRKPAAIRAYWNKDFTVTLRSGNRLIHKFENDGYIMDSIAAFLEGWFGTADKKEQKVKWYYR